MQYNVLISAVLVGFFVYCCSSQTGELNYPCQHVTECRRHAYQCGRNFTCQCIYPLYIPNRYMDKCVGIVGQKCEYDEHCIDGAFCKGQKECECKHDLVPSADNMECSYSYRSTPSRYTFIPVLILVYLKLCSWIC